MHHAPYYQYKMLWSPTSSESESSLGEETSWGENYGGGGYEGGSQGGGPPSSVDFGDFLPQYNDTDRAFAWIRLVLGSVFIVLGTWSLVSFYRSRWVLDIRTRSARLVMLGGILMVLSFFVSINTSCFVLWGKSFRWFWASLLLFFVTPILFGSYVCRALRLAVVFHPSAKRALPWLIPERNYLYVLLVAGFAILAIPIYHEYTLDPWEIIPKQTDMLALASIVLACILMAIYPFIRKVDDIFSISKELTIVTVALLVLAVGGKLVDKYGDDDLIRWIGPTNLFFFVTAFIFGVSVVDPLRRLAFDPLAGFKRKHVGRVLLNRRDVRTTARCESEDEGRPASVTSQVDEGVIGGSGNGDGGTNGRESTALGGTAVVTSSLRNPANYGPFITTIHPNSNSNHYSRNNFWTGREEGAGEVWSFERVASTPLLAVAFEEFSRKALCHESVLFLSEVSRYESLDYSVADSPLSAPSQYNDVTQFDALCRLAHTFVRTGAREEINISDFDRRNIMSWVQRGQQAFDDAPEAERRLVFGQAYVEVRNMLEMNLLLRFLSTDEFKRNRVRREHITTMMDSPERHTVS